MARRQADTRTDRRRYLQLLGLGGASVLAGCSGGGTENGDGGDGGSSGGGGDGDSSSDGSGDGGGDTETATEDDSGEILRGGTLRITLPQQLVNQNPLKGVSATDYAFAELSYSRLTRLHHDTTEAVPDLADEWESNSDVTAWTFMLNEDATWPDPPGGPVTAEDVAATVDMMMNREDLPTADRFLGGATDTDVVDEKTITINLDSSDTEYPRRIAETGSTFNIVPKAVIDGRYDELSARDFGSGPFTLVEAKGGSEYTFEARDDYFREDDLGNRIPYVDELKAFVVRDALAQTNGLVDQRYDAILQADPTMESRINGGSVSQMYSHDSMELINILLNTDMEPFDDNRVRQAIKYALDKEQMIAAIDGRGSLGFHHSVSPLHKLFAPDIDDPFGNTANPEKARDLLEEAGFSGDPLLELPTLTYSKQSTPEKEPQAQLFQEQMRRAGIEFEIQLITTDTWLTDYWNKDKPWYFSGWAARAVESSILELGFHSESKWNSARYSNPEYDEVLESGMGATNAADKREAFREAQQILHLDGPWIVTTFVDIFGAWNDYVKGVEMAFTNERNYFEDAYLTEDAPMGPSG